MPFFFFSKTGGKFARTLHANLKASMRVKNAIFWHSITCVSINRPLGDADSFHCSKASISCMKVNKRDPQLLSLVKIHTAPYITLQKDSAVNVLSKNFQ